MTEEYQIWQGMIKRCYNKELLAKEPAYLECEVCSDWCNYQIFAEWSIKNIENQDGNQIKI